MLEQFRGKRILVVVAHPDDELLGLGASMHKLISEYDCTIRTIILGEGITSRADERDPGLWEAELKKHRENIKTAADAIGYESLGIYDFPDNRFDSVALLDIVKVFEKEKSEFRPEVVFTHHGSDTNVDHRYTFNAVMTGSRPMKDELVRSIYAFETPSSTEWQAANYPNYFQPNFYIPVSKENVEAKIKGMESYEFEKRAFPHPRSPEALDVLSRKRGVEVGADYAEAFMLIRSIG